MYKKCENCYKDGKVPNEKSCKKCEDDLKRKEQECEELKIYIESNEQQVKEVETLVMDNDRLINELNQLKQALTEIKEIAEFGFRPYKVCGEHNNCCDVLNEILQKCEVLDEN